MYNIWLRYVHIRDMYMTFCPPLSKYSNIMLQDLVYFLVPKLSSWQHNIPMSSKSMAGVRSAKHSIHFLRYWKRCMWIPVTGEILHSRCLAAEWMFLPWGEEKGKRYKLHLCSIKSPSGAFPSAAFNFFSTADTFFIMY